MSKDHDQDKKPEKKQDEKIEVVDQSRRRFLATSGAAFVTAQAASVGLITVVGSQAWGEDAANIKAPPNNRLVLPQLPQRGVQDLKIDLPNSWEVEICQMLGHDRPEIDREDIRKAIRNPIGTPSLQKLAKGKKEVAILFDDYARGSKWADVATVVLEELASAGIKDENIRFICALGCHAPANRTDFVRKLSEEIVSRYAVYNHDAFHNLKNLGTTKTWNTPVEVNQEVMKCDLKIALGATIPHPLAGFGGGSKIILPGISSYDTIEANHKHSFKATFDENEKSQKENRPPKIGLGVYDNVHPVTDESDEAAEMVGLDFLVNTLVNSRAENCTIYAGDYRKVHTKIIEDAKVHYASKMPENVDIIFANAFYKANEYNIVLFNTPPALDHKKGGDIVVISNCPEGMALHYYVGIWGKYSWAAGARAATLADYIDHCYLYNEYPYPGSFWPIEPLDKISNHSNMDEILTALKKKHGDKARVAVFPNGTIQYMPSHDPRKFTGTPPPG